jgi:hypothetical protein
VSSRIQRNALRRARDARRRAENARQRGAAAEARGDSLLARLHLDSAARQEAAAQNAETLIKLDREVEGDQLEGEN